MRYFLFFAFLSLNVVHNINGQPNSRESSDVIVIVSQGSLRGQKVTSNKTGGEFYSFKGIPYAQPPVGDLRFKAPRAPPTWPGIRDATYHRDMCSQPGYSGALQGSEDCLYLNVYTPQLPSDSGTRLAVMVWIPGGAFMQGSGNSESYSPDFLVDKGVVLVTLNYRLGVLGFLGLNNSLVSQNNGFKDQMAAIKWVQANIEQFGGDKDQVTIFGESAGGASIELQVLSPATRGLFHRAISMSGNAIDRWPYSELNLAKERAFKLGRVLGFTGDDEDDLIHFLKDIPAGELVLSQDKAATEEDVLRGIDIPFHATKESGEFIFLPDSPLNILKSGNYNHVPYITGFVSAEAKTFLTAYLHIDSLWTVLANNMEKYVPPELGLPLGSPESLRLGAEIKNMYFGNDTFSVKNIEDLVNVHSDSFFVSGVRRSSNIRSRTSSTPVYVYQFSYVGRLSLTEYAHMGYPFKGAGHADDLGYLFSVGGMSLDKNSTEMSVLHNLTTMWTNFAKTGNPGGGLGVQWDALTSSKKQFLNIDTELSVQNLDELHVERLALWDKIYATIDN